MKGQTYCKVFLGVDNLDILTSCQQPAAAEVLQADASRWLGLDFRCFQVVDHKCAALGADAHVERLFASDCVVLHCVTDKWLERKRWQSPVVVLGVDVDVEEELVGIAHLENLVVGVCKLNLLLEGRFLVLSVLDNVTERI